MTKGRISMHRPLRFALPVVLWSAAVLAGDVPGVGAQSSELDRARTEGEAAAESVGAMDWFGRGLLGGLVAGPVGAGVATYFAGRRPAPLPAELEDRLEGRDPAAVRAFQEGFSDGLGYRRQRFALRGGIIGSVVFAGIILTQTDIGRDSGRIPQPDDPLISFFEYRVRY